MTIADALLELQAIDAFDEGWQVEKNAWAVIASFVPEEVMRAYWRVMDARLPQPPKEENEK